MARALGSPASALVACARWAWRRPVRLGAIAIALACDTALLTGLGDVSAGPPLDLRLFYTPAAARRFLEVEAAGVRAHMIRFGAIDLVFLAAYGLLMLGVAHALLERLTRVGRPVRGGWPYVLAALPAAADLVETATILAVNLGLRAGIPAPAAGYWVMAAATPVKWLSLAVVLVLAVLAWARGRAW